MSKSILLRCLSILCKNGWNKSKYITITVVILTIMFYLAVTCMYFMYIVVSALCWTKIHRPEIF